MDKSWIKLTNYASSEYVNGVNAFLDFAFSSKESSSRIYCPCTKCQNRLTKTRVEVKFHCLGDGFDKNYKNWHFHGEHYFPLDTENENFDLNNGDDMIGMLHDAMGISEMGVEMTDGQVPNSENFLEVNNETRIFFKLLQDAETELYHGCTRFTKLSFVVRLLKFKVESGLPDIHFDSLLQIFREALPDGSHVPENYYHANKITEDLGFTCEIIDACPNHCMLFRGEDSLLDQCEICGELRYKSGDKKIPTHQMRYFPLKFRLQKLFMCSRTASLMKWHDEKRENDGVFRHPADSLAWKDFDGKHPDFAADPRNIRLGLSSDGFNPFRTMNVNHSTWPIVLMVYNLPPWLCMKKSFFILSVLINGPKSPGNKIDVYMQPLIDDLKELWSSGVRTYDASSKCMFELRAALLWTISDYPAFEYLSGWGTKGQFACPYCGKYIHSSWLDNGRKFSYRGHRCFLPVGHPMRRDTVSFNGKMEFERRPLSVSGNEFLNQLNGIPTEYKKEDARLRNAKGYEVRAKESRKIGQHNWKKKSILFELDYWESNILRHNVDSMHNEKNVTDNFLWTLLGGKKSKDNINSRKDLQKMNIRGPLHPKLLDSGKYLIPPASYTLSTDAKDKFLKVLKGMKAPNGYVSNISRCVRLKEQQLWGLKSHDSHILMQQILPVVLRGMLPKSVVSTLIELSNFFKQICSKVNTRHDLEEAQKKFVVTLCHLEKIFPPSFFDVMEHLPIHIADQALKGGAIQFRWMYPIERYLMTLKKYVRNRAHPEGSIAKGYLIEECMHFCSQYLGYNESEDFQESQSSEGENIKPIGKGKKTRLDLVELQQIHRYVLNNVDEITHFRNLHLSHIIKEKPKASKREVDRIHNEHFPEWFRNHVQENRRMKNIQFSEKVNTLADGLSQQGKKYNACLVNGFRFRTKAHDMAKVTQNSGVIVRAQTLSYSSAKDKSPHLGLVNYYGVLTDIIEIQYTNNIKYLIFKCDWVSNDKGVKVDAHKFTMVNFNHLMYNNNLSTDEPFVFANQVEQIWYLDDPVEANWKVVMTMSRRDHFGVYSEYQDSELYPRQNLDERIPTCDEDVGWVNEEIEGLIVDENDFRFDTQEMIVDD